MRKRLIALSAVLLGLGHVAVAVAQTYPSKPIRIIVPYATGGSADGLMRPLAQRLAEMLGQPMVIDNRAGANGIVGSDFVAKSAPDGYTLLLGAIGPVAVSSLMQPLPYDPVRDFVPVAFLASVSNILVVSSASTVKTVRELVVFAKAHAGKLSYGSTGVGSSNQLAAELFKLAAGVDIIHVPYKGGAPMHVDLIGGHLTMLFDNVPAALPQIRGGAFRALAVASLRRHPDLPDVPTMDEAGYPKFETGAWYGVLAPAGTPRPIVEQLNTAIVRALREPALRDRYISQAFELNPGSPEQFGEYIQAELTKWRRVINAAGIKAP